MALVTVDDVLSYLGHDAEQDAFWVYCSDATAIPATTTVQVSLGFLIIQRNGANVAGTPLNLAAPATSTITLLVQAINALLPNIWHAGVICHPSSVSLDLLETGQLPCVLLANEQTIKITGDYLINQLIARATDFLNRICGRTLEDSEEDLCERYDGGEKKIFLKNWPVNKVSQVCSGKMNAIKIKCISTTPYNAYVEVTTTGVTLVEEGSPPIVPITHLFTAATTLLAMANAINGELNWQASVVNSAYNSYLSTQLFRKLNRFTRNQDIHLEIPSEPMDGYEVEHETGILRLSSGFTWGWRNIFVTYQAGYLAGAIPPLLQQICIELIKNKYNLIGKDTTLKSEKIGRVYAYTMGDFDKALGSAGLSRGDIELFMDRV